MNVEIYRKYCMLQ